jgi:hypothetical protein
MKFVKHANIDKAKWDALVENSTCPSLYLLSWYLDATCYWDAMVWGDYEAAMPFPTKRFLFFKKLYQPIFVQKSGLFYTKKLQAPILLKEFFNCGVPGQFHSFRMHFRPEILILKEILPKGYHIEKKKNYLLDLCQDYHTLYQQFNQNRKRNLKKARELGWETLEINNIDAAIKMYKQHQAKKQDRLSNAIFKNLKTIFEECQKRGMGKLFRCTNQNGSELSYGFFVEYHKRIYYLFGAMNDEGREHSASSLIFDDVIRSHAGGEFILDFEGGNMKGIGNYFASFNSAVEEYPCVYFP